MGFYLLDKAGPGHGGVGELGFPNLSWSCSYPLSLPDLAWTTVVSRSFVFAHSFVPLLMCTQEFLSAVDPSFCLDLHSLSLAVLSFSVSI